MISRVYVCACVYVCVRISASMHVRCVCLTCLCLCVCLGVSLTIVIPPTLIDGFGLLFLLHCSVFLHLSFMLPSTTSTPLTQYSQASVYQT